MTRYTFYVNFKDLVIELPLPAVENRSFSIDLSNSVNNLILSFEVYDDTWEIIANDYVSFDKEVSERNVNRITLSDSLKISGTVVGGDSFAIIVSEITDSITTFTKYSLEGRSSISIGRSGENDICVASPFVGAKHAVLTNEGGKWYITDHSSNGSYINGERISSARCLKMYDIIYTVGFKMVFLGDSIALNRSDIVQAKLPRTSFGSKLKNAYDESDDYFSPSPRTIEPLFNERIEIEAPPTPQKDRRNPLIFVVGPSVTMPLPILMSTLINSQINNGASGSAYIATIASVGMSALLGAGWAVAHYVYNKRTAKIDEKFRVEAYQEYIHKNELLLKEKHSYNNSILLTQFLSSNEIVERFMERDNFIWNRNVNHSDFLRIRLGKGTVKFSGEIAVPKQRFSLYKDDMAELPHKLQQEYEYMKNTTVLLDLNSTGIVGAIGDADQINEIAVSIAVQIAALHSYTDVKIAALFTKSEEKQYRWLRWLPHCRADESSLRYIADEEQSYRNVLYAINNVLRSRFEKMQEGSDIGLLPHYVVFCTSPQILDGDSIERYISEAEKLGVTFVLLYKKLDVLPNECKTIIQSDRDFSGAYSLESKRSESDKVVFDTISYQNAERFARKMSAIRVREYSTGEIPASIEYFDMVGIGNLLKWDLVKKYKENRVYEGMPSFIGIGVGGKPIYLDICEKRHGPHGLVAGTTGSGKSETLQTFIISLALNYHPNEIAFVLVDFKGGGMANAFIGMPHIAGTITNLDGNETENGEVDESLTRRALVSIKSEKNRRQSIFNKYGISHIDDYIKLFRENKADEALPHLIIILDEFAELKKEQPEFINELVSTARVGRSLGIHLILATQKPAGVVDDEIWSNSRFKLCLRVQDKQDSMGMLKRPEAAFLTHTGRAYLQIGNDEVFEQFQTGYSGAPYSPKDEVILASESDFAMINIDGTTAISNSSARTSQLDGVKQQTQLEAAIRFVGHVCNENGIAPARMLWLPILPNNLVVDNIIADYSPLRHGISAVMGVIDDPENQRQYPLVLDITKCSNLIIAGSAGSGKTTFIQTMLRSLSSDYSSEQVNFYILDFSSRTLKIFKNLPHCGLVAFSDDEEAVSRLFVFISAAIEERKGLFDEANVGSYQEYVRNNTLPLMLVVIDNYLSFADLYQNLQDDFIKISRDCVKYGIQIIITINNFSDIRSKARQNFSESITLTLNDKSEYREAFNTSVEFMPRNVQGRGIVKHNGRLLEYQTALPIAGDTEVDRNANISNWANQIKDENVACKAAKKVRVLPKSQTYSDFYQENVVDKHLPIGYFTSDISVYALDLKETFCYAISNVINKRTDLVFNNVMFAAKQMGAAVYAVKLNSNVKLDNTLIDKSFSDKEQIKELLLELKQEFHNRSNSRKSYLAEKPDGDYAEYIYDNYKKIFVIIDSMAEFISQIYDSANQDDLHSIPETLFKLGKGHAVYFIAGFDTQMYSGQGYYYAACKNFVSYSTGIHLGGCLDKQKLFSSSQPMSKSAKPLPPECGFTNIAGDEYSVYIPNGEA